MQYRRRPELLLALLSALLIAGCATTLSNRKTGTARKS